MADRRPHLTAMCGVYDEVPEPAPYPHVSMGEVIEEPDDTHDNQGLSVAFVLHIWSKYRGFGEVGCVLSHLDRQPLDVAAFFREHHHVVRDPNPTIRHCPVRYRMWLNRAT